MERINEIRNKIDAIDKEIAKLFEQRINFVKEIAKVKKELNYPSYDQGRETFVLIRNGSYIEDKEIRMMYFEMMKKQFELTKKMQEDILHQSN